MPTLDQLRAGSERRIEDALENLYRRHRQLLEDALAALPSPATIPAATWNQVERETEEDLVALLLLAMIAAHDWTAERIAAQGVDVTATRVPVEEYAQRAAIEAQRSARQTTQTARSKLVLAERQAQQQQAAAAVQKSIDDALEEIFAKARREMIAMTETTAAFSTGQIGARDAIVQRQQVVVDLVWTNNFDTTKKPDQRVCPICRPLHGTTEDVWSLVLPEGPGDTAHPQCRCGLDPRVIVTSQEQAA